MFNADKCNHNKQVSGVLGPLLIGLALAVMLLVVFSPYRLARPNAFFEPWDDMKTPMFSSLKH